MGGGREREGRKKKGRRKRKKKEREGGHSHIFNVTRRKIIQTLTNGIKLNKFIQPQYGVCMCEKGGKWKKGGGRGKKEERKGRGSRD